VTRSGRRPSKGTDPQLQTYDWRVRIRAPYREAPMTQRELARTYAAGRKAMDAIPAPVVPTGPAIGWRVWQVSGAQLLYPFVSHSPLPGGRTAWVRGINIAQCIGGDHEAPQVGCECGYRAMPDREHLLITLGAMGPPPAATLRSLGAIGQVRLSGTILGPSANDPGGCLRGSRAELTRLMVHPARAQHADALGRALDVGVEVRADLDW
jgi:hypothetical protein